MSSPVALFVWVTPGDKCIFVGLHLSTFLSGCYYGAPPPSLPGAVLLAGVVAEGAFGVGCYCVGDLVVVLVVN